MKAKELADCPALGPGWMREEVFRKSGASAGKTDVYYYSPTGERFRSKLKLVEATEELMDLSDFNFRAGTMTGPCDNKGPGDRKRASMPDTEHDQPSCAKKLKVIESPTRPVPAKKFGSPIQRSPSVKRSPAVKNSPSVRRSTSARRSPSVKCSPADKRTRAKQQNPVRKCIASRKSVMVAGLRKTHADQRTKSQSGLVLKKDVAKQPLHGFSKLVVQPGLARIIVFKEVSILDKIKQLFQGGQMEGKSTLDIVSEVIDAVSNPWLIQGMNSMDWLFTIVANSLCYCWIPPPAHLLPPTGAVSLGHSGRPDHWPFIVTEDDVRQQEERVKQARRRLERALVADSFAVNTVAAAAPLPVIPAGAMTVPAFAYPVVLSVARPVANVGDWTGGGGAARAPAAPSPVSLLPTAVPVATPVRFPAAVSRNSLVLAPLAKTLTVTSALPAAAAASHRAGRIIVPVTCIISQVAAVSSVPPAMFPATSFASTLVTPLINSCKNSAFKA